MTYTAGGDQVSQVRGDTLAARSRTPFVKIAAAIGAAFAAFEAYIIIKWIAGPNFQRVTWGPTEPPTSMKVSIIIAQILFTGVSIIVFYWLIVRPWRRERTVTFNGLFYIAWIISSAYDSLSCYFHNWFVYNTYFFNMGAPLSGIPGWRSYAEPGAMAAFPLFWIPQFYGLAFVGLSVLGCRLMRRVRDRYPSLPTVALVLICYLAAMAADIIVETIIMMRPGWYAETGASFIHGPYGPSPVSNLILASLMVTAAASLQFFRNDRGETLVERGLHTLRGQAKATIWRFFAILAAVQIICLATYHIPMAIWTVIHPVDPWPAVMRDHSYLNSHICGVGTPRKCPGE